MKVWPKKSSKALGSNIHGLQLSTI